MEKKLDRRIRYTRRVIKESFISLLMQKPLNRITVKEICTLAEINRATFYAHYSDQYALMRNIEDELVSDLIAYLGLEDSSDRIPVPTVDTLVRILDYVRENADIISILLGPSGGQSFRNQIVDTLKLSIIQGWPTSYDLAPGDTEYAFTFVLIGSVGMIEKWLNEGMEKSTAELARLILWLAMPPQK